jgi:hypothetical protein
VKFHVSTLLEKFEVRGRVDLMIEAAEFLPIEGVHKRVAANAGSSTSAVAGAGPGLLPIASPASPVRLRVADTVGRRAGD